MVSQHVLTVSNVVYMSVVWVKCYMYNLTVQIYHQGLRCRSKATYTCMLSDEIARVTLLCPVNQHPSLLLFFLLLCWPASSSYAATLATLSIKERLLPDVPTYTSCPSWRWSILISAESMWAGCMDSFTVGSAPTFLSPWSLSWLQKPWSLNSWISGLVRRI